MMKERRFSIGSTLSTAAVIGALLLALVPGRAPAQVIDPTRPTEAVPKADCGPGSRPETMLQGQVPLADRQSGRSREGYQCNLELVSTAAQGEGASWQFAWYDHCAYYGTLFNDRRQTKPGTVVIDASDPQKPFVSAVLDTPAMNDPHESLKVNEKRGLLAAVELSGGEDTGPPGEDYFDVYDVSGDCAHPKLLASQPILGTTGHEGEWAPDGLTYYGSGGGSVNAIDVTDPRQPRLVAPLGHGSHGLGISDDGNHAYLNSIGNAQCPGAGAMRIVDVSEVQARKPNPTVPFIGEVCWNDGTIPQHSIPLIYSGKPYLLHVDEAGRGAARIIDISDETAPTIVSRLKLEVHLDQYAPLFHADGGPAAIFVYDAHYCSVDRQHEPTIAACGYFESGIRVFDIRDPEKPSEIAYYNPPARPDEELPGSSASCSPFSSDGCQPYWTGTADHCSAQVRIVRPSTDPKTGKAQPAQLWTQCQDNEFMILEFTNDVWPFPGSIDAACPPGKVPTARYNDVGADTAHAKAIDCVTWWKIATGKTAKRYDPAGNVSRGQMASFIVRMIESAGVELSGDRDHFSDDDGTTHEAAINKLAAAGVVSGRSGRRFAPFASVNRAQMATFLAKGYELASGEALPAGDDAFDDDNGSPHEKSINKLAAAGMVLGTGDGKYSPGAEVPRAQMASFLARGLNGLVTAGEAAPPKR